MPTTRERIRALLDELLPESHDIDGVIDPAATHSKRPSTDGRSLTGTAPVCGTASVLDFWGPSQTRER